MDTKETILMPTTELEDTMNLSRIKSVKLLRSLSLISMLPQQWLEHKITVTTLPVVTKLSTQETSEVFQIWLLCHNHTVMSVKTPMDSQQGIKLEYMTSLEIPTKAQINTSVVK